MPGGKTNRRGFEEDEQDVRSTKTTGKGWGTIAAKKKRDAAIREEIESRMVEFFLTEDDNHALVQFTHDEPFSFESHNVQVNGRWKTVPCQLLTKRKCRACAEGGKVGWRAAFKIFDLRGSYNKEKGKYDGKPKEKLWMMTNAVADQLESVIRRKGVQPTEVVFEVSRSGTGKNTTYSIQIALDDNDKRIKPKALESEYDDIEQVIIDMVPTDAFFDSAE